MTGLPWRALVFVLAASFAAASVVSALAARWLMPSPPVTSKVAASHFVDVLPLEHASLDAAGIAAIVNRNVFSTSGKPAEDDQISMETDDKAAANKKDRAVETTLPLKLVGTIYGGDPANGIALIEDTVKHLVNSFFVGDGVAPDTKITAIYREKVFLQHGEYREYLLLKEKEPPGRQRRGAKPVAKVVVPSEVPKFATDTPPEQFKEEGFERNGGHIVISSDYRKKLLTGDFAKVLQDAKAEPFLVGGELAGFKLTRIREDSVYQKAGLQDGDVIKEINGVSLVDTAQAIKLLNSLRQESELEVRLERAGSQMNLNLQVR